MYGKYTTARASIGNPVSSTMRSESTGTRRPLIIPRNAPTMMRAISPVSRFLPTIAFGRARPMRYVRRGAIGWDWIVTALHLLCSDYLCCRNRPAGSGCCGGPGGGTGTAAGCGGGPSAPGAPGAVGRDTAADRVGGASAASSTAVLVVAAAVRLDALGDECGGRTDQGGGLGAVGRLLAVGARTLDLVAEAGDEAVDHRRGEDGEQDDGEAGDDGGERVGAVVGGERAREAEDDHDHRLDHDHRDHDARPAAYVAPHVLVDQPGVHHHAQQRTDVEEGRPDDQLQPEDAERRGGRRGRRRSA